MPDTFSFPSTSPFTNLRRPALAEPQVSQEPQAPTYPVAMQPLAPSAPPPLPTPPPAAKRATIWDKEHISETLAGIGQAFLSHQNFGDGLGAVAGVLGDGQRQLRQEAKPTVTYGGPDGQFAISTDHKGNRSIAPVPEFVAAVKADRAAKVAPTPAQTNEFRARAVYQINQLPADQRAAAFQQLLANPAQFGVDPTGLPAQWSDQYGAVAGNMGLTVNQAETHADTAQAQADKRDAEAWRKAHSDQMAAIGRRGVAVREKKLRTAPPSTRKGYAMVGSEAEYNALPQGSKYIAPDGSQRIKN